MSQGIQIHPAHARRAPWYVVSGALFIITGLLSYYQVTLPSVGAVILIGAGVAVILLGLFRYHPTPDALVIFIISLLAFGAFTSGFYFSASHTRTFSFTRADARYQQVSALALSVSESLGSISVSFVKDPNLLVNLTYGQGSGFFFFPSFFGATDMPSVTNATKSNSLTVFGSSSISSLDVVIGNVKVTSLNATATTGSVSFDFNNSPELNTLAVATSTGSISIQNLKTSSLTTLQATTSTGSVSIDAHYSALPTNATLTASASTGSISLDLVLDTGVGCNLSAAATGFGSVSPNLSGFQTYSNSNPLHVRSLNYGSALHSVVVTLTTSTGSVSVDASAA